MTTDPVLGDPVLDDSLTAIMTVRNGEPYLAEALDSILGQSTPADEVVVVDDGSADGTPAMLAAYGDALRVIRQPPSGHAAAMNAGIAEATGSLLSFLDADDVWEPDSLACRIDRLHQSDAPEVVFGRIVQFVSPDLGPERAQGFHFDPEPSTANLFQAMLIRREALERVGVLDVSLPSAANVDWMSRARIAGLRVVRIENVVARRRLHRTNMGVTMGTQSLKALTDVVRMHHERTHGRTPPKNESA